MELDISTSVKQHHKGSTREKTTTINYVEDPRAAGINREINELRSRQTQLQDKIRFMDQHRGGSRVAGGSTMVGGTTSTTGYRTSSRAQGGYTTSSHTESYGYTTSGVNRTSASGAQ